MRAELIDQVGFTPPPSTPSGIRWSVLWRTNRSSVDRARLHRRLAAAIESRDPELADENAALIATHLEAAGELA